MFIVALGGAVGSSLRMAVSRLVDTYAVGHFPYPTMTVNVVGCLLIGVFYGLSMRGSIGGDNIKMLLTTGLRRLHHVQHLLQREPHAPPQRSSDDRPAVCRGKPRRRTHRRGIRLLACRKDIITNPKSSFHSKQTNTDKISKFAY